MRQMFVALAWIAGIGALVWVLFLLWVHLLSAGFFDDPADGFRDATDAELIAVFTAQRTDIERLRALHLGDRRVGAIGTDNIGRWWRHGDRWRQVDDKRVVDDRAAVLAAVALRPDRDAEYRRLFAATAAYRVQGHDAERVGYDTEICLTRRGNVVRSVCKSFVFAPGGNAPPALVPREGDPDSEQFTPLGDGWYLRTIDH